MQMPQAHTIQRQTIEILVADAASAQRLRQQADLLCRGKMGALLDRVFSSVMDQDRVLQFDRLDLHVNISCPARFDEEFVSGVEQALQEALQSALAENGPAVIEKANGLTTEDPTRASRAGVVADEAVMPHGPDPDGIGAEDDLQGSGRRKAKAGTWEQARAGMLVFFLKTGHLPWWAPPREAPKLEEHLLKTVREADDAVAVELRSLLKDPRCRRRLALQFSTDTLCEVIAVLVGGTVSDVRTSVAGALTETGRSRDDGAAPFWEIVLEAAADPGLSVKGLQSEVHRAGFVATRRPQSKKGRSTMSEGAGGTPGLLEGQRPIDPIRPEKASPSDQGPSPTNATADSKQEEKAPVITDPVGKAVDSRPPEKRGKAAPEGGSSAAALFAQADGPAGGAAPPGRAWQEAPDAHQTDRNPAHAVAVENAGLVLLWPFLGRFFQGLGLTGQRGFVNPGAACRGVHLLQYLVFGATGFAEPLLLLNKILCGLPSDFPVARRVRLDQKEKEACRTMLQAVIGHWQALKNTTVQGLQTAFVQRFGLLSRTDTGWGLRVARSAHDLLLDRLPWGIAVVRLSWMKQALMVDW